MQPSVETPNSSFDNESGNIPFPFCGVFSEVTTKSVGFGATKRREKIKRLWFLERDDEGKTFIRALSRDYLPTGEKKEIPIDKAVQEFLPEPGIYMDKVAPKLREVERLTDQGDEHRANEEYHTAEYAYQGALGIDEDHIRANFGIGLTYLHLNDKPRARKTFKKIVSMESAFEQDHKHLFNEFGISLRKNGMYDECVTYYKRALALHTEDDHIHFNLARAFYDKGDYSTALDHCIDALAENPELREARQLRDAIYEKDPALRSRAEGTGLDLSGEAI